MNITKQQKSALITILIVAFVTILMIYLFVSLIFKVQLLTSPCELCAETKPYLKQCFGEQTYYNNLIPGGINFTGILEEEL